MTFEQIALLMHTLRASAEEMKALFPPLYTWMSVNACQAASLSTICCFILKGPQILDLLRRLLEPPTCPPSCAPSGASSSDLSFVPQPEHACAVFSVPSGQTQKPHRTVEEQSELKPRHPPSFA